MGVHNLLALKLTLKLLFQLLNISLVVFFQDRLLGCIAADTCSSGGERVHATAPVRRVGRDISLGLPHGALAEHIVIACMCEIDTRGICHSAWHHKRSISSCNLLKLTP